MLRVTKIPPTLQNQTTHHLVVLRPNYLSLILDGTKTMECRLTRTRKPPYGRIQCGDVLWLKVSSGPVLGTATVGFGFMIHPVGIEGIEWIQTQYGDAICAEDGFYGQRLAADFATLTSLTDVKPIDPLFVRKTDRRAWVILDSPLR